MHFGRQLLSIRPLGATLRQMGTKSKATEKLSSNSKLQGLVITLEVLIGTDDKQIFHSALAKRQKEALAQTSTPKVYDTSKEIDGLHNVQTKYMEKIKQRLGKADARPVKRGKGDSALLQVGKEMEKRIALEEEDYKETKRGSSAAWLLQLGMGNLLDYFISRSVAVGKC